MIMYLHAYGVEELEILWTPTQGIRPVRKNMVYISQAKVGRQMWITCASKWDIPGRKWTPPHEDIDVNRMVDWFLYGCRSKNIQSFQGKYA